MTSETQAASIPYIVGVAGPSCAGKTELSRHLAARLSAVILPLDCYYLDLGRYTLEERSRFNFDEPKALDHELFVRHLKDLSAGHGIQRPIYDFAAHTRTGEVMEVKPERFVIVEGLFVLFWEDVRPLIGTGIYVDLPDDPCLKRRIVRDTNERGRTPESVLRQFEGTVQPMAERYVRPTREFADVVVAGDQAIEVSVEAVLEHIRSRLPGGTLPCI